MSQILAVALGGALGSVARFLLGGLVGRMAGTGFPWGTLAANVIGGLAMGILVGAMAQVWSVSPALRAFLTVGLLGGFTTFSAFSLETVLLFERGETGSALAYALASVVLSIGALWCGLRLARVIFA